MTQSEPIELMPRYRDWLSSIPFEHVLRKREPETALARWRAEASAFRAAIAAPRAPRVVLLLDVGDDAESYLRTLASWALQTWPETTWVQLGASPEAFVTRRNDAGLPGPAIVAASLDAGLLRDIGADWIVFAKAGDILHPSLAGEIAIAARAGAKAVAWDFLRYQATSAGKRLSTRHRGPGIDPLLDLVSDWRGRAFALPVDSLGAIAVHPDAAWEGRLAAGVAPIDWRVVPEPLSLHPVVEETETAALDSQAAVRASEKFWKVEMQRRLRSDHVGVEPVQAASSTSVIILFRDRPELTIAAIDSVTRQKVSGRLEIVLVDNQSHAESLQALRERVARLPADVGVTWVGYDEDFNHSRQCMLGASAARGEVLVFLNNDASFLDDGALEDLGRWARLRGVASVGACIIGADGKPAGGGFVARRVPGAEFNSPVEECTGFFATFARLTVGNTFACAAVSAGAFASLGGLDSVRFPIGFNDVDYCLRAAREGWMHINLGHVPVNHSVGASRARVDEIAQKLALRMAHPWLYGRALCEPDIELCPAAPTFEFPEIPVHKPDPTSEAPP